MKPLSDYRRIKRAQKKTHLRLLEWKRTEAFLILAAKELQAGIKPEPFCHNWYEQGDE